MKKIISSAEIIPLSSTDQHGFELCATAEGNFDEQHSRLLLQLDSFVRPTGGSPCTKACPQTDWLPRKQTLKESVSREEASDLAREIFQRWCTTVRQSIPSSIHV